MLTWNGSAPSKKPEHLILLAKAAYSRQDGGETSWQVINNVIPLGFVLIFASFQHYIRRRNSAH